MRPSCVFLLFLFFVAPALAQEPTFFEGFEEWNQFDTPAGNRWLENYVKGGWLGDTPPYYLPRTDFQMGPARLYRREGTPGKEIVSGKYALGIVTKEKPVNVLMPFQIPCNKPGKRFKATVWLRGKGIVRFRAYEYNRDNHAVGTPFFNTCEVTPEWKAHEALFENTRSDIKVWGLVLEVSTKAEIELDDVAVGYAGGERIIMPTGVPTPVSDAEKVAVAFPRISALQLDGKLTDPAWQQAEWHSGFLRHQDQARISTIQAQFAFLYDSETLYLGFASADHVAKAEETKPTAPGEWPSGNPVEFFLDPGATRDVYYQFAANIIGGTYESIRMDASWNCKWTAKGFSDGNRWTLEAAIPFAAFGRSIPKPGEVWALNLCRNGSFQGPWAPVGPNYHRPAGFGTLTFGSYAQWWNEGVVPWALQQNEALDKALSSMTKPDMELRTQLTLASSTLSEIQSQTSANTVEKLDRAGFLALYHGADKIRRLLENVAHEWRWLQAIKSQ